MILVTGATGSLGNAAIEFLITKVPTDKIAALARDENKAAPLTSRGVKVRKGNYDDTASLVTAFQGIEKLFFISGSDVINRQQQHNNIVQAAKNAGIRHIVYTSFARKNETESNPLGLLASSHIETDKMIKASGLTYTIMLNNLYADVLPMFFGDKVFEQGIFLPAGDGKAGFVARTEIAEAAANILTGDGHENKEYIISNTDSYSFHDAAQLLSELSGRPVTYNSPATDVYEQTLVKAGVPKQNISVLSSFSEAIKQGEFETSQTDLKNLLGRNPGSLKDFFKATYFADK